MNLRLVGLLTAVILVGAAVVYYNFAPGSNTLSQANTTTTTNTASSHTATTTTSTTAQMAGDWTTYHRDNSRSGYDNSVNYSSASLGWKSDTLDGAIYAEPLVFNGTLFAVTESNSVYAMSATSGRIIWHASLGLPVPRSALPCGDIDPTGITSTPVIDVANHQIFVVAFLNPAHHVLYALDTTTGSVRFQHVADPSGMNPVVQQQRSALTLANGYVYIPYGGLEGDCGQYHGWMAGIKVDGSGGIISYQVPTNREGGIWAPSGAVVDSNGNLYVTTGNGASSSAFDHGNSVIELSPALQEVAYFAPSNWAQLNAGDVDLGSVGPALLGNGLIFQIGKEGRGFLLNSSSLGGVGGKTFSQSVCSGSFGGIAFTPTTMFVPCINGLFALNITGSSFQLLWKNTGFFAESPILTGNAVWTAARSSSTLYAFQAQNGKQLFSYNLGSAAHFTTPTSWNGLVFVAANDQVLAFIMTD